MAGWVLEFSNASDVLGHAWPKTWSMSSWLCPARKKLSVAEKNRQKSNQMVVFDLSARVVWLNISGAV